MKVHAKNEAWESHFMMHPKLLDGLNCESKGEDNIRIMNWGAFVGS